MILICCLVLRTVFRALSYRIFHIQYFSNKNLVLNHRIPLDWIKMFKKVHASEIQSNFQSLSGKQDVF